MSPGIRVNGAALPIAGAKVITGRSGCWIGPRRGVFLRPGGLRDQLAAQLFPVWHPAAAAG